jgi:hypothetical protein
MNKRSVFLHAITERQIFIEPESGVPFLIRGTYVNFSKNFPKTAYLDRRGHFMPRVTHQNKSGEPSRGVKGMDRIVPSMLAVDTYEAWIGSL